MAYYGRRRYRRKPSYRRRTYGTRRKSYKPKRRYGRKYLGKRGNVGFPQSMSIKLKYAQEFDGTGVSGGLLDLVFRANSLHDPEYTGTGSQYAGHDALATIYSKYRVYALKFVVTIRNKAAVTPTIQILDSASSTALTSSIADTALYPRCKTWFMNSEGADKSLLHAKYYSTQKGLFMYEGSKDYTGTFGANPANEWFIHLLLQDISNTVGDTQINVKMTAYAKVWRKKNIGQN